MLDQVAEQHAEFLELAHRCKLVDRAFSKTFQGLGAQFQAAVDVYRYRPKHVNATENQHSQSKCKPDKQCDLKPRKTAPNSHPEHQKKHLLVRLTIQSSRVPTTSFQIITNHFYEIVPCRNIEFGPSFAKTGAKPGTRDIPEVDDVLEDSVSLHQGKPKREKCGAMKAETSTELSEKRCWRPGDNPPVQPNWNNGPAFSGEDRPEAISETDWTRILQYRLLHPQGRITRATWNAIEAHMFNAGIAGWDCWKSWQVYGKLQQALFL